LIPAKMMTLLSCVGVEKVAIEIDLLTLLIIKLKKFYEHERNETV
jgi:hypothetical protein